MKINNYLQLYQSKNPLDWIDQEQIFRPEVQYSWSKLYPDRIIILVK